MTMTVSYPQMVELYDGSLVPVTEDTWRNRQLIVETDRSETQIRDMLAKEGFRQSSLEFTKSGQLQ